LAETVPDVIRLLSFLRRRWPEAVAALALAAVAAWSGFLLRALAIVLLGAVLAFAVRRRVKDVVRAGLVLAVILVAAAAATLVVDLGPALRRLAETEGSRQIERPLHIARLGVHIGSGRFVVDGLHIAGKRPGDEPFFTARRISVGVPWWRVFRTREILIESVELSDWTMLVEDFREGGNSFIRIPTRKKKAGGGDPSVRTTLKSVHAGRGRFTYIDHGTWRTTAANLDIVVENRGGRYLGRGSAKAGLVHIDDYLPMRADMRFTFEVKGGLVDFDRIDLFTDGARSLITGRVNIGRWPEQTYRVHSRVDLWRMREIFFAGESWRSRGEATFDGTFHLFKGGHRLEGDFASDLTFVNRLPFPRLRGSLVWEPERFDVTKAVAGFSGGQARFTYSMAPLGRPTPALARFDVDYAKVDLGQLSDLLALKGLRLEGQASGRNLLEWPLGGGWPQHRGGGVAVVTPPEGVTVLPREPAPWEASIHAEALAAGPEAHYSRTRRPMPVGGRFEYTFGPEWVDVAPSHLATERTYVEFEGRSAYAERARYPFYARSADWQESDRVLAAVLTAFGSATNVVAVGGHGEFRGVMLGAFRAPRIEGRFAGGAMRAWDVVWGDGSADLVIENGYVDVTGGRVVKDGGEVHADGRFSLGYPRADRGEEINARVRLVKRPLAQLRHAFELDDWPVNGNVTGEYHLYGRYQGPFGFGQMTITEGTAWGEPFEEATTPLRFEGSGVRLEGSRIRKGTGAITAAAHVLWEGRYSFNADGRRIPMEAVAAVRNERAPLSGLLHFRASGAGEFLLPRYEVHVGIDDLFVGDEGIGQAKAHLSVRERLLTIAELEIASPRLAVSGTGRVEMSETGDAELTFRVSDTSLDPYVRAFEPRLSPFTRAIASGSIRVVGQLYNPERLAVQARVESLDLRLFDYRLRNDGPLQLAFDRNVARLERVGLVGADTKLELSGDIDVGRDRIDVKAGGATSLAVLQGFFRDIRSSGRAELSAAIRGSIAKPVFSGSARIADGRIRYFGLPHSIQAINGRVGFTSDGIQMEDLTAEIANGQVRFGGGIELAGYTPGQLSLSALAENMELRYPEGVRSVVDADLQLVGTFAAPTVRGTVNVKSAVLRRRIDLTPGLLELVAGRGPAAEGGEGSGGGTLPLRFDLRIIAPSALRVDSNLAQIVASGDLTLRGDYSHPVLLGRTEIERGQALFEGKRYVLRGLIDFNNPRRIEPFLDINAQTRVRAPGQTYNVELRLVGTPDQLEPQMSSDPPLPTVEILSLLFGDPSRTGAADPELGSLQRTETQGRLGYSRLEQAVVGTLSGDVTRAVEQAFGLDTFQITPSLFDPYQRVQPTARLTVGKRISDRVYLTFSRSLNTPGGDQVLLLEYDQSERLSWIFSRNEDATYALDVRVRHVF
jgi:hypothetical protein